jgi:hypothetical protein
MSEDAADGQKEEEAPEPTNDAAAGDLRLSYPKLAELAGRGDWRINWYLDVPAVIVMIIVAYLLWQTHFSAK